MIKYTLVTGSSGGIGEGFAREYAKRGRSLILVARSCAKLEALAASLREHYGITVHVVVMDLSRLEAAQELFDRCHTSGWEVECLINNAGVGWFGGFDTQEREKLQQMLLLNMVTLTNLAYLFLPQLKENKGVLINIASRAGFQAIPYLAAYAATKAYVLSLTEALSSELKESGISVLAVAPGPTHTGFFQAAAISHPEEIFPDAQTVDGVVSEAMTALSRKQTLVICGRRNRILHFFVTLLPRRLLLRITDGLMKRWHFR